MLWPFHHLPDSGRSLHRKHIFRLFSFFTQFKPILSILTKPTNKIQIECYHCEFGWFSLCWMVLKIINLSFLTTLCALCNHKFSTYWVEVWNEAAETSCWTWQAFYLEIGMEKQPSCQRRNCYYSSPVIYFMPPNIHSITSLAREALAQLTGGQNMWFS